MTQEQWQTEPRLFPLLNVIREIRQPRKWRLLACACVRDDWDYAPSASREAIEAGEAFADQQISRVDLKRAEEAALLAFQEGRQPSRECETARRAVWLAHPSAKMAMDQVIFQGASSQGEEGDKGLLIQALRCDLIRDVFGNPFRPVQWEDFWLTPTVVTLAQVIYENRKFTDLPILGDALEDSGCSNLDVLSHCREDGTHVLGCWVLDLVLGKDRGESLL